MPPRPENGSVNQFAPCDTPTTPNICTAYNHLPAGQLVRRPNPADPPDSPLALVRVACADAVLLGRRPVRLPVGNRHPFNATCNIAMLRATLPARRPGWPRMVLNAGSALPMLIQPCLFSSRTAPERQDFQSANHRPPRRTRRPVRQRPLLPPHPRERQGAHPDSLDQGWVEQCADPRDHPNDPSPSVVDYEAIGIGRCGRNHRPRTLRSLTAQRNASPRPHWAGLPAR